MLVSLFIFTSCRKLVQDEFPNFEPVPCINSILVAGKPIKVHISLATKLDKTQLEIIDNAQVQLYIDGQFAEILNYEGEGIYVSTTISEPLINYNCQVSIPDFETIECNASIPEAQPILDIVHINNAGVDEEGLTYPAVQFSFPNNPDETTYYEAKIIFPDDDYYSEGQIIYISDPVLLNEGLPMAVFSNELIETDTYTMTINYYSGHSSSTIDGVLHTMLDPFILELRTVSYDYYTYVKQQYLYETGRYPDIVGGVITPFPLHSNIEDAYGIFAGYSVVKSDTIFPNQLAISN